MHFYMMTKTIIHSLQKRNTPSLTPAYQQLLQHEPHEQDEGVPHDQPQHPRKHSRVVPYRPLQQPSVQTLAVQPLGCGYRPTSCPPPVPEGGGLCSGRQSAPATGKASGKQGSQGEEGGKGRGTGVATCSEGVHERGRLKHNKKSTRVARTCLRVPSSSPPNSIECPTDNRCVKKRNEEDTQYLQTNNVHHFKRKHLSFLLPS
jgi:hypothetical protein